MSESSDNPGDQGGWEQWRALTTQAYTRFQDELLAIRPEYPGLTGYEAVERANAANGTHPWQWGAHGEVLETVNSINAWGGRLHAWNAWNRVIASYDSEQEQWEVLGHFVEPIAFFCMLQPSSLADRLMVAAETLLHQANLRVSPGRPDALDQDTRPSKTLRRSDRRKQLHRLGADWTAYPAFRAALEAMNGEDYQKATRNFRDLTNHSFAPRFMIGEIVRAIRAVVPRTDLVDQGDGTSQLVPDPTRTMVQYAMHSMAPLPLEAARSANLAEYVLARETVDAFAALIAELCDHMDALPDA